MGRKPDISQLRRIFKRNNPWANGSRTIEIFPLCDIEFRVPNPVSQGSFVAERQCGDMIKCSGLVNMSAAFANDDGDFTFLIEFV